MTPLARLLRNFVERWQRQFYEGPDAPARLADQVVAFANAHPRATRAEWVAFASENARACYRSGYMRGLEWTDRDLARRDKHDPELEAEAARHDWSWEGGMMLERPLDVVPDADERDQVADINENAYAQEVIDRGRRLGQGRIAR